MYQILQVLVESSCGDPREVVSKSFLHDLVQALIRRSCGDPGEVLSRRSLPHEDLADAMY